MTNKPAWFARSLPYGWQGGRIQVDGDDAIWTARRIGAVILAALCAWGVVYLLMGAAQ